MFKKLSNPRSLACVFCVIYAAGMMALAVFR